MKRLSSYFIYLFIVVMPLGIIPLIISDGFTRDDMQGYCIYLSLIIFLIFVTYHSKRVFYKNSSIYLYNLFSNKFSIINKEKIGGIDRLISYDPNSYKLLYYDDENNVKYIYFIRNNSLGDFSNIIDEINDDNIRV
jgi:hypothetical protein